MATTCTVNNFYSNLKTNGVKINHMFRVSFTGYQPQSAVIDENDALLIQTATLPQKEVEVGEVKFHAMTFSVPTNVKYDNSIDLNFIADANLNIKEKLDTWVASIADLGQNTGGTKGEVHGTNINLHLLDNDMKTVIRTYVLVGAFPTKTGSVQLDQSSTDIVKLSTNWKYQYWYEKSDPMASNGESAIEQIFDFVAKVGEILS